MLNVRNTWFQVCMVLLIVQGTNAKDISSLLYPWNLSMGSYYTHGEYSTGQIYKSQMGYFSMDKRWKDRFSLALEKITISGGEKTYNQTNFFGRDYFYIKPEIGVGGIVGLFKTDTTFTTVVDTSNSFGDIIKKSKDEHHGWVVGVQISGDLPWVGYATSYIRSDYQYIYRKSDEYRYDESNEFTDTTYVYDYYIHEPVDQWSIQLSRRIGNHIVRLGGSVQQFNTDMLTTTSGVWTWTISDQLGSTLSAGFGKSRYTIEPALLLLNNNPDFLRKSASFRLSWRVFINWRLKGVVSYQEFQPLIENPRYHVVYGAIGIQGRF